MIEFKPHVRPDQTTRIELIGRLDLPGVEQIDAPLTVTIRGGSGDVLFDLNQLSFVGSLGIRLLISSERVLKRAGRKMALFGVQPQVAEVFETVTLGDLIPIAGTEAEAVSTLSS